MKKHKYPHKVQNSISYKDEPGDKTLQFPPPKNSLNRKGNTHENTVKKQKQNKKNTKEEKERKKNQQQQQKTIKTQKDKSKTKSNQ